jgi:hypothetical protein
MAIHSANPTVQRREERLLRERLAAMDGKVTALVAMGGVGAKAPAFPTTSDIEEVGKLLVEGRLRLPKYARVTVTTEIQTVRSKIFGTSEIYHHLADQLCADQLQPMSIPASIEAGLLAKVNGAWLWRDNVYRALVPPDPRLIP